MICTFVIECIQFYNTSHSLVSTPSPNERCFAHTSTSLFYKTSSCLLCVTVKLTFICPHWWHWLNSPNYCSAALLFSSSNTTKHRWTTNSWYFFATCFLPFLTRSVSILPFYSMLNWILCMVHLEWAMLRFNFRYLEEDYVLYV